MIDFEFEFHEEFLLSDIFFNTGDVNTEQRIENFLKGCPQDKMTIQNFINILSIFARTRPKQAELVIKAYELLITKFRGLIDFINFRIYSLPEPYLFNILMKKGFLSHVNFKKRTDVSTNENEKSKIEQIENAIKEDNLYEFKKLCFSQTSTNLIDFKYTINKSFPQWYVRPSSKEEQQISLIESAAFYGAVSIFKYLYVQISEQHSVYLSAASYAIAGGEYSIIHDIEHCCKFGFFNFQPISIKYHLPSITKWLKNNYTPQTYNVIPMINKAIESYDFHVLHKILKKIGKQKFFIHMACKIGNLKLVQYLIKNYPKNTSLFERDTDQYYPLHYACQYGHYDVAKYILQIDPSRVDVETNFRYTSLHLACKNNHLDIVKLLVDEFHANILLAYNKKNTPIGIACSKGNYEIFKFLFNKLSEENIKSMIYDFLKKAFESKNEKIIKDLVDHPSFKSLICQKEEQANLKILCNTASCTNSLYFIKFAFEHSDITEKDLLNSVNENLLHFASRHHAIDVVKYLVNEKHFSLTTKDNHFGFAPIHEACQFGSLEILKFYLDTDSSLQTARTLDLRKPLHVCAKYGQLQLVKYLVEERKDDYTDKNKSKQTPCDVAVEYHRNNVVSYFHNLELTCIQTDEKKTD